MKGMTAKVERADWLRYPTEDFIFKGGDQKPLKNGAIPKSLMSREIN